MPEISLKAEELFHIGLFPVTNSLLLAVITLLLISAAVFFIRRKFTLIPGKIQNILEAALEGLVGLMGSVLGSRKKSEKYLPLVATIFVFVLFSNWFGLLPGLGSLVLRNGEHATPILRSPSSDLNFTLALAIIAVIGSNLFGILALGFQTHNKKFINFQNPIAFFVGLLELISEFAKMVSFSFRLFGNIFAGEVLLLIIGFLVPYVVPLPFLFLEIFVGFIQAFIFAMLTLVFIAGAVVKHEEAH